jgi:hypothetical protein
MGFVVIIFLSFNNYSSINKMKKNLEIIVREDALKEVGNKK